MFETFTNLCTLCFQGVQVPYSYQRLLRRYEMGMRWLVPSSDVCLSRHQAAANASSIGADPSKGFIVGGTSAGGSMTSVVAHLYRDEKPQPGLTGCLLVIPAVSDRNDDHLPNAEPLLIVVRFQYIDHPYVPDKYKKDYNSFEQ